VDEVQYAKDHKYLTLVYQIESGCTSLLWVGQERTVETFQGFLAMLGTKLSSHIQFVCSDMWEPLYLRIRENCSQALHIIDRFTL
jgi:transposase